MKTKRQILIDRRIFTVGLLVIIGLYCVLRGMSGIVQTTHALSIDRLTGTGCKNGRYVAGYIDSFVVKGNNEHYTGVSGNLNGKVVLTVPIADGEYIRLLLSGKDKEVVDGFGQFVKGRGEGVWFEGRLKKSEFELNEEWYRDIEGFQGEGIHKIIPEYYIVEDHFHSKRNWLYFGLVLLGIAGIRLWFAGGRKNVLIEREAPVTEQEDWKFNKEGQMKQERIWLTYFERQLDRMRKFCLYNIPFLLLGFIITIKCFWIEDKMLGVILIMISATDISRYLIQKNGNRDSYILRLLKVETIAMKIDKHRETIVRLESHME